MKRFSANLPRLMLRLLILPFVLFWVPLMFAMAWMHEVVEDLRSPHLRPMPARLPAHGNLYPGLPSHARPRLRY